MAGPDLSVVTAVVDFYSVLEAVLGVAGALIVVHMAWKGAKMIIAAVRGDDEDCYDGYTYEDYERDSKANGLPVEMSREEYDDQPFIR